MRKLLLVALALAIPAGTAFADDKDFHGLLCTKESSTLSRAILQVNGVTQIFQAK